MTNYDDAMFSSTDAVTTNADTQTDDYDIRKWSLGNHARRPTIDATELRENAALQSGVDDEMADLLEAAATKVEGASLHDFECPVCGLSHGHDDQKHDIRSTFNVTSEFAEFMQFNPACHCGVNELAVLVDFFDAIRVKMFSDEDEFAPFSEMMPSVEADSALAYYRNPDNNATVDEALTVSNLQSSKEMRRSFKAFNERTNRIKAVNAPIPPETEAAIENIREQLEDRFDE